MSKSLTDLCQQAIEVYGSPQDKYSNDDINRYYRRSYLGYKLVHSRSGAMHMKIAGQENGQGEIIAQLLTPKSRILEVGCGNGTNLAFLQQQLPASWAGIDLSSAAISRAKKNCRSQTDLRVGSFQQLPFDDNSFDYIFAIETLCHADDRDQALAEAHRVLAPSGQLFIWDGWRRENLSDSELGAASLAERAMAVNYGATRQQWITSAQDNGFQETSWKDYSTEIMANTERFQRHAQFFVDNKRARIILKLLPGDLRTNGVAALLIHPLLSRGVWEYGFLQLTAAA